MDHRLGPLASSLFVRHFPPVAVGVELEPRLFFLLFTHVSVSIRYVRKLIDLVYGIPKPSMHESSPDGSHRHEPVCSYFHRGYLVRVCPSFRK